MDELLAKGVELINDEKYEEAIKEFESILNQIPDNTNVLYNLALCCDELGKFEKSVIYYKKLLEFIPEDLESYIYLTRAYLKLGENKEALKAIENYLSITEGEGDYSEVLDQIMEFAKDMKEEE